MSRFLALVCSLLALVAGSLALGRPVSGRALLATFSASDICTKPQEVAITIANTLVQGSGLSTAESEVREPYFVRNNLSLLATMPSETQLPSLSPPNLFFN